MARGYDWLKLAEQRDIDWDDVAAHLPFSQAMKDCIQDSVFHREGDVWTHTRMVVDELRAARGALGVARDRWPGLFLAALLHDIAKPDTRAEEHNPQTDRVHVTHKGHARAGAIMAWTFLWREGVPRTVREQVFHLIRWHQRPFHLTFADTLERDIIHFSVVGRWPELLALAAADARGRIAPDITGTLTSLDLLRDEVRNRQCLAQPWPFATDHARVWYFQQAHRSPHFTPPNPKGSRVIMVSGLPGAGKDTYCTTQLSHLPAVSLDAWRTRLKIAPDDPQGEVIQAAMEEARGHLRANQAFAWNATNVSRLNRDKAIGLCLAYDADVEVHAIDPGPDRLFRQNSNRKTAVPAAVMERLLARWEPPSHVEAHRVRWIEADVA